MSPTDIRLRIIAGQWRRRVIRSPALEGIRPTTDRIRETLFNWLAPHIVGARCCDAFAGTGILGLEALSRGAEHCTFIDNSAKAMSAIQSHLLDFSANNKASCLIERAEQAVLAKESIDVLFLDPPFDSNGLQDMISHCCKSNFLANEALIYVEYNVSCKLDLPEGWSWYREGSTQRIAYGLLAR